VLSVAGDPAFGAEKVLASFLEAVPKEFAKRCLLARPARSSLARWATGSRARQYNWPARRDTALFNLLACFPAARQLRPERIGLVHAWGARGFETSLLLGRLLGAQVSGTLLDHPRASFLTALRKALIRQSAPRLRPLVCVSHAVANACHDSGLHGDRIVIPSGALPASSPRERSHSKVVRVGFFGLYARWKGFEAVRDWIEDAGPNIEWHLCGEPAPALRPVCEALKAKRLPNVAFRGWVDGARVMEEIDVLLHASTEFDPLPTVLIEAARAGIPAVASDLGGPREIVEDGVTGFLFSPSDPTVGLGRLRLLVADPALRARMGTAARNRFQSEFAIGRMVDSYLALWEASLAPTLSARC